MIKTGAGPTVNNNDGLILIKINQEEGNRHASNTTWAKPLGDDLYEISHPLSLISGFDVGDVVRAIASSGESMPTVVETVQKGDYRTVHVSFLKGVAVSDKESVLSELSKWNATHEMTFERFYTVVVPESNYDALCEYLKSPVPRASLVYEPAVDLNTLIMNRFLEG